MEWATRHNHVWMRGISAQMMASLSSQMDRPDEALHYATIASTTLELIGADSTSGDISEFVALGHLAMGHTAEARVGFEDLLAARSSATDDVTIIAHLGLAEVDRADGRVEAGLVAFRQIAAEQSQLGAGDMTYGPWSIIIQAACLGAHVLEDEVDIPILAVIADALVGHALVPFADSRRWSVDVPVLGCACLGLGAYLTRRGRPEGPELVALAERLSSRQELPALNRAAHWHRLDQTGGPEAQAKARAGLALLGLGDCLARAKVVLEAIAPPA